MNSQVVLGTKVTIDVPTESDFLLPDCFSLLIDVENRFSRFKDSLLTQANARLGEWQDIPEDFLFLMLNAKRFNHLTEGAFDITIKQRLDALGYDAQYSFKTRVEKSMDEKGNSFDRTIDEIKETNYSSFDIQGKQILLRKEIDFGGMGKGYAIDRVAEFLQGMQVPLFTIDAGGDILVKGHMKILLEHPDDFSKAIGEVMLHNQAIAGSAGNRRKWGEHHHIINPKTGQSEKSMKAVWVISETALDADAYATSLFAAGFEKAIDLIQKLSLDAIVISSTGKIFTTTQVKWYDQ